MLLLQQQLPPDLEGLFNKIVVALFLLWPLIGLLRAFLAKLFRRNTETTAESARRGGASGTRDERGSARDEVERALEKLLRGELPEDPDEEPAPRPAPSAPPPLPTPTPVASTSARSSRAEPVSVGAGRPLGDLPDAFDTREPEPLASAPSEDELERVGAHAQVSLEGRSYDEIPAAEQQVHSRGALAGKLSSLDSALPAFHDAHAAADSRARAQRADPHDTHAPRHALRIALGQPGNARRAIVLAELLGPPLALRTPRREPTHF